MHFFKFNTAQLFYHWVSIISTSQQESFYSLGYVLFIQLGGQLGFNVPIHRELLIETLENKYSVSRDCIWVNNILVEVIFCKVWLIWREYSWLHIKGWSWVSMVEENVTYWHWPLSMHP